AGRSGGTAAAHRSGPRDCDARGADAAGAGRVSQSRDRDLVADHQGGQYQAGVKGPNSSTAARPMTRGSDFPRPAARNDDQSRRGSRAMMAVSPPMAASSKGMQSAIASGTSSPLTTASTTSARAMPIDTAGAAAGGHKAGADLGVRSSGAVGR